MSSGSVQLLQRLGFSEYEARAYVALLQRSPLNGYELAQLSRLPRANIYAVLDKLEERGAVARVDTDAGKRYCPTPVRELIRRLGANYKTTLHSAESALGRLAVPAEYDCVSNSRGYGPLLDNARAMLDGAQARALIALSPPEARALSPNLAAAEARGVSITTLCREACPDECGHCRGQVFRYALAGEQRTRWLVIVPDNDEMLAGEIGPGQEALAVRTRQPLLVSLADWYIRNSVALAAVLSQLGNGLDHILTAETRAVLQSVGPGGEHGWLEHMRRLLRGARRQASDDAERGG